MHPGRRTERHVPRRPHVRADAHLLPWEARAAHPLDRRVHRPGVLGTRDARAVQRREPPDQALPGDEDRSDLRAAADVPCRTSVWLLDLRLALPGPARPDALAVAPS